MGEFLQDYGMWIVFGLLFLVMVRAHSARGGMGCGMAGHQHQETGQPGRTAEKKEGDPDMPKGAGSCH